MLQREVKGKLGLTWLLSVVLEKHVIYCNVDFWRFSIACFFS